MPAASEAAPAYFGNKQSQDDTPAEPLQHQAACHVSTCKGCAVTAAPIVSGRFPVQRENGYHQTAGVLDAATASGKDVVKQQLVVAPEHGPLPVSLLSTAKQLLTQSLYSLFS